MDTETIILHLFISYNLKNPWWLKKIPEQAFDTFLEEIEGDIAI